MIQMKIRPEDRPKLIGIVVGFGVLIAYFAFVVLPMLSGKRENATPVTAAVNGVITAATPVTPPVTTVQSQENTIWGLSNHPGTQTEGMVLRDPFIPLDPTERLGAFPSSTGRANVTVSPLPGVRPVVVPMDRGSAVLPVAPRSALPSLPGMAKNLTSSDDTTPIELSGVLYDSPPMALFRIGDQTYTKHEGDHVLNLVVVRIQEAGVLLRRGQVRMPFLYVGHTLAPASNPAKSPADSRLKSKAPVVIFSGIRLLKPVYKSALAEAQPSNEILFPAPGDGPRLAAGNPPQGRLSTGHN